MAVELSWQLVVALGLMLLLTVGTAWWARTDTVKDSVVAAVRSVAQLALISVVIVAAIQHVWSSLLVVLVMLAVAVITTARRTNTLDRWWWVALDVAAGTVPVLAIVFFSGTMPWDGKAILPIAGIVVGNMMTAHTLLCRRAYADLRTQHGTFEAALALGLPRRTAINWIVQPLVKESLIPNLDTTKTVGLVKLPGAFIGVLLGGGTPVQAGAAQVLVLFGIMGGQTVVAAVGALLIRTAHMLPADLRESLHV